MRRRLLLFLALLTFGPALGMLSLYLDSQCEGRGSQANADRITVGMTLVLDLRKINEDYEQNAELRLIVPDMKMNGVRTAIAPTVTKDKLSDKVRCVRIRAVFGIGAKLVGCVGDGLVNELVDTIFCFR